MFKKSGKRNFRKKARNSDSENEDNAVDKNTIPFIDDEDAYSNDALKEASKKPAKKKDKASAGVAPAVSLLSFDDEEEATAEVFKIKKSSHSRRIAKQLKRDSKKEKEELTANETKQATTSVQETSQNKKENSASRESPLGGNGRKGSSSSQSEEEDEQKSPSFHRILESGAIPDAAMIHLARKRRQQAREMGDFIPLEKKKMENTKSRLIREEDEDHSDEDDHMSFTVNTKEQERRRMQDRFLAAEQGSNSEASDQEQEWELQQIKKGVSIPQVQTTTESTTNQDQLYNYQMYVANHQSSLFNANSSGYDGTNFVHAATTNSKLSSLSTDMKQLTISDVKKRLQERLDSLTSLHSEHVNERDSLSQRLQDSHDAIHTAEGQCASLEEQFKFFQEMRGYVRDLVDCLNEKVPKINALESSMHYLLKQRAEKYARRRQEDIKDQAADNVMGKAGTGLPQDAAKQRRTAEREARRARRRRAREGRDTAQLHHEGLSSDDEENQSDVAKYNIERERILDVSASLFEDVADDFSLLKSIARHFEKWKRTQTDTYQEAYIGLCLPKLFSPYVRAHLVLWNPLEAHSADFENSSWYEALMFYSFTEDGSVVRNDQDVKLVPSVIDKVLIPKVTVFAESIWDPMSSSQTKALAAVLKKLMAYPSVNMDNKNTQLLIRGVVHRMRRTLDDDVFMPLYPKQILEKSSGANSFFQRQQWSCIKLLGNILSLDGILSEQSLQELALDGLLNRYLMLALQVSEVSAESIAKCQTISSKFPKSWFVALDSDSTLPQLETFCRYLTHAAQTLDKRASGTKDLERKEARDGIKQVTKMLVLIHALDHAVSLASQFSVRL